MKLICENIIVRCVKAQKPTQHPPPQPVQQTRPQARPQIPRTVSDPAEAQADSPLAEQVREIGSEDGYENIPNTIFWRGCLYRVRAVQGTWRWCGAWWTTPSLLGQERIYFRVLCAPPGGEESMMELYCERGRWTLSRLLD